MTTETDGVDEDASTEEPRSTAPMSAFTVREVAIGVVVLAVGLAVAFGVPLLAP